MKFDAAKPVIAVTGSAGKTMVKTLIAAILKEQWHVFESNHYNNTFQKTQEHASKIDDSYHAAVLEYGMAFPGAIAQHCKYIEPNIAVITNVGLAHICNFEGKIELLAAAKSEIIKGMKPTGILYINADDKNTKLLDTKKFRGKIITVGIKNRADYTANNIKYDKDGMKFDAVIEGKKQTFSIPAFGRHNVYNALFAIAVSHRLGFSFDDMRNAFNSVKRPEHRLDIIKLKDDITIIDDTVHSNPVAVKAAIDVLENIGKKKNMAILGSMSELGDLEKKYHIDIGKYIASKNVDYLYTHGNVCIDIGKGATKAGFPAENVWHKTRLYRKIMLRELVEIIKPGFTILVKGYSGSKMYEIVEYLCQYYK